MVMYGKSESILHIRLWMREYEMFEQAGEELEALDSLIQTVAKYPELYSYAVQWNAGAEVSAVYTQILQILEQKYSLTEQDAQQIASEPDDIVYTKMILAVTQGKSFNDWAAGGDGQKPRNEFYKFTLIEAGIAFGRGSRLNNGRMTGHE